MNANDIAWKIAQKVCEEAHGKYDIDLFVLVTEDFGRLIVTHLYKPIHVDAYRICQVFRVVDLRSGEISVDMAMAQYEPLLRELAQYRDGS